ncbi:hypothetical protein QQ045_020556 [Rhodiola kirilowii]
MGISKIKVRRLEAVLRKEKKEGAAAVDKDYESLTSKKRSSDELDDGSEVKEEEDVKNKEKLVVATKKGAAVLDQWLPESNLPACSSLDAINQRKLIWIFNKEKELCRLPA